MPDFVSVGRTADFPEGRIKAFTIGGKEVAVVQAGGRFFAFQNVCTHDDGPLNEGCVVDGAVECPRHGAQFSMETGDVLRMPASFPIEAYEVRVEGGEVKVSAVPKIHRS